MLFVFNRGLSNTAQCSRCGYVSKDILHCLRDCPSSYSLQKLMGYNGAWFGNQDTSTRLITGLRGYKGVSFLMYLVDLEMEECLLVEH